MKGKTWWKKFLKILLLCSPVHIFLILVFLAKLKESYSALGFINNITYMMYDSHIGKASFRKQSFKEVYFTFKC